MRTSFRCLVAGLLASPAAAIVPLNAGTINRVDPKTGAWKDVISSSSSSSPASINKDLSGWKSHNFSVPVDHFHNESIYEPHSDDFYPLRYWVDDSNYQEGGPVIVLSAGELDAAERKPYVAHGIAHILAKATGGLAVLLEHRYYGTSFPTPDLSTENLRFLSTEQAMADTAYFARHVQFPGRLAHLDLTAPETAWIIYGGSYAGGFAAFMRKIYPDEFWGAISASGVTEVIEDYWEYYEAARLFAPGECGPVTQELTHVIDTALFSDDAAKGKSIKHFFGLGELSDAVFGEAIQRGVQGLQATIWDPEVDVYDFGHYCGAITSNVVLYASTQHLAASVKALVREAGYKDDADRLTAQMLNYIGYVRSTLREDINKYCKDKSLAECFGGKTELARTDYGAGWLRSWTYQTCTQWGYFVTGSGVPKDQLPMISRAVTLEHVTASCRDVFNITTRPDVESINKMGGTNFTYPRLAFVDGAQDPWRAAGPHRIGANEHRESTVSEPFLLVDWGVHHWDEYGVGDWDAADTQPDYPPKQVVDTQRQEVEFVKAWMEEFYEKKKSTQDNEMPGEL